MHHRAFQDGPSLPGTKPEPHDSIFAPDRTIRTATPKDLAYVDSLQKKFSNQIGFIPRQGIEWLLDRGRIELATENGDPCGYIAGRTHYAAQPTLRPITQAAVQFDAQRRHHGLALLENIQTQAITAGQIGLQACCREGLEANEFWKLAGFIPICVMTPENRRNKSIICWRKPLVGRLPLWFAMPPRRSGYRAFLTTSTRNPRKDYHELAATLLTQVTAKRPAKTPESTAPQT